ncbi:MAG: transposase [bacterium]
MLSDGYTITEVSKILLIDEETVRWWNEKYVKENIISDSKQIIEYIEESHYIDKAEIRILLDNARYYKNKEINKYLKTSRIKLIYLPPYSPNLNLIERLWKLLRKKVMNNRYFETVIKFRDTVFDFFESIDEMRSELETFIGNKLHLFPV